MHLAQLMTSWAVVCDVWYLEPQFLRPGESPIEFAERYIGKCYFFPSNWEFLFVNYFFISMNLRVREIISVRAGLKMVPWDGYLKYSRPSPKHKERK